MLHTAKFEVTITGTHGIIIPIEEARPFIEEGQSRVALKAFFEGKSISFHGKLHQRNGTILISFGKRYQKELGVTTLEFFLLQIIEDVTEYGVEMPEELSAVLETDSKAFECFKKLTNGKKRSLIYHILRIKNTQTRIDKALLLCENLSRGLTDIKKLVQPSR